MIGMWRRGAVGLTIGSCLLLLLDAIVFRSGLYFRVADPESSAGYYEREIRTERQRRTDGRKQILIVGDSRAKAIRPHLAEEWAKPKEIDFANAAVDGSTPRAWFYLLRDLDPGMERYQAIVFGVDDFDDNDGVGPVESTQEVEMAVSSLGWRDLFDFPFTFQNKTFRRDAFLQCLLKGSAYKRDFQELLSHPVARWKRAAESRRKYAWFKGHYVGADWSLDGLEVDWASRKVKMPDVADVNTREEFRKRVENPIGEEMGWKAANRREWLTRIVRRYGRSSTLLVFMRLPSSPVPTPAELRAVPLRGMLRDLASRPNILLLDEHLMDALERPEYFYDFLHLNARGATAATKIFVEQLPPILARAAGGR